VRPGRTHGNRCSAEAGHPFMADAGGRLTGRPGAHLQGLEPANPWAVIEWNEAGGPASPAYISTIPSPTRLSRSSTSGSCPGSTRSSDDASSRIFSNAAYIRGRS
jgi:hypothetical protein